MFTPLIQYLKSVCLRHPCLKVSLQNRGGLDGGSDTGYGKMVNVFLNGTKNDGYDWHNYWGTGYEAWATCDSGASPHGHHVAFYFPTQMLINMLFKPSITTRLSLLRDF
jgi:hypothetical protein